MKTIDAEIEIEINDIPIRVEVEVEAEYEDGYDPEPNCVLSSGWYIEEINKAICLKEEVELELAEGDDLLLSDYEKQAREKIVEYFEEHINDFVQ